MTRFILTLVVQVVIVHGLDKMVEMLKSTGYPYETHHVTTIDGYMLSLHRIPPKNITDHKPEVFLLMHGLIGSSSDFILPGKDHALGCILHDQGYDVWLPNSRGNTWSKNHQEFSIYSEKFWDFSWHEMGIYDMPAILDYILSYTRSDQLHYVAHSQGSTILFVMLSEMPEYNKKIISAHLMAPVAYIPNIESPILRQVATNRNQIWAITSLLGIHELFPNTILNRWAGRMLCGFKAPFHTLCTFIVSLVVGFSDYALDKDIFTQIFQTTPAGISTKQFLHFGQLVASGRFQKFDYGSSSENYKYYKTGTPPEYNLNNVKIPLTIYHAQKDFIVTRKDINMLLPKLTGTCFTLRSLPGFNHMDLLYGIAAPRMIYKRIVTSTKVLCTSPK